MNFLTRLFKRKRKLYSFEPDYVVRPSETIKESMEYASISRSDLFNRDLFGYDPNNFEPFICHGIVDENDKTDASRGAVIRDEGISGQWYRYEIVGKIAK